MLLYSSCAKVLEQYLPEEVCDAMRACGQFDLPSVCVHGAGENMHHWLHAGCARSSTNKMNAPQAITKELDFRADRVFIYLLLDYQRD